MAWIEKRKNQHRVYWKTSTGRQYEPFASHSDAERFITLANALNDLEKARAFVRGADIDLSVSSSTASTVPATTNVALSTTTDYPAEVYQLRNVFAAYLQVGSRANARGKDDYARDFRSHIAPYFGEDTDIRTITGRFFLPGHKPDTAAATQGTNVGAWLRWLSTRHALDRTGKATTNLLSPKTIRGLHGLLSGALEFACRVEPTPLIMRNPCRGSVLPQCDPLPMNFLTKTGAEALLRQLNGQTYVVVLLALYTGLRFGEIAGLDVRDLDLDAGVPTVQVRQAWARVTVRDGNDKVTSSLQLARPKTLESHRKIGMPKALVPFLRPLVDGRPHDAPVFTMPMGGRLHHGNFLGREFRPAVIAAAAETTEVPRDFRIHDLRHTHASWMVRIRPLSSVRVRLGHKSIKTTERYIHLMAGQDVEDAEALDSIFVADAPPISDEERARLIDPTLPISSIDDHDDLGL